MNPLPQVKVNGALSTWGRMGRNAVTVSKDRDVRWQAESMSKDHCNPYRRETQARPVTAE